jgi:hypothetical protein
MRRAVVTSMIVMVSLLVASPAALAGGSWMNVTQVNGQSVPPDLPGGSAWAPVGATVTMQGQFCTGALAAPSSPGPWFAYLSTPGTRTLLGPVEITPPAGGVDCPYVAHTTFVVPDVAPGFYTAQVCNVGCHNGIGDLIGGSFTVASTSLEAVLLGRLDRAQDRANRLADKVRHADAKTARLAETRAELDAARQTLAATQAASDRLVAQRDAALKAREAAVVDASATARTWKVVAGVLAFLMLVTWVAVWVRRRNRLRIKVPDTIEELVSADHPADR